MEECVFNLKTVQNIISGQKMRKFKTIKGSSRTTGLQIYR